jgi:hypothetical protein
MSGTECFQTDHFSKSRVAGSNPFEAGTGNISTKAPFQSPFIGEDL